jgi:phospholipase/carboxylesterase
MFHGAGSMARRGINPYLERAERLGIVLLALDSRGQTWDVILGNWGPDVAFVDRALADVFKRCRIDPARITTEGFSDGATYALSLGLSNGDLFTRIVAFSPGFVATAATVGEPLIWISHGVHDSVLPIAHCGRRVARDLQRKGYDITYREFAGGHEITSDLIDESLTWQGFVADA